jgi:hypothetical protein
MATRLRFTGNTNTTFYIDLAKEMSAFHRRMHRQGRYYNIVGGYLIDSNSDTRVDFATAPDHWTMKNAYKRAFRLWKKQRALTLSSQETGSQNPKYADFKVFLNNVMGPGTLRAKDASGNEIDVGDWEHATLRDVEANDGFTLQLVGPHVGAPQSWSRVGVLQSWFESRPLPNVSPGGDDAPGIDYDDPMLNMFNASGDDDEILRDIIEDNDQPPYDKDGALGYLNGIGSGSGNNLQRKATAKLAVGGPGLTYIPSFGAMCGLLEMDVSGATGSWEVVLDVEVGGKIL